MDNNERIAVALERIANVLEKAEKRTDEFYKDAKEDSEKRVSYRSCNARQTETLYFDSSEFLKLYLFVKDRCDNYGFCRLGDVKEEFKRGVVDFTDWSYGWEDPGNMVINELDEEGDRIELVCRGLVRRKV